MPDASTPPIEPENAPAEAPARKERICPNCGEPFFRPARGPGGHKRYCTDKCRVDWGNREKAEGAVAATLLKIWTANRDNEIGNEAFARLREIGDVLNENDRNEGRPALKFKVRQEGKRAYVEGPLAPFLREVVADHYLDRRRR